MLGRLAGIEPVGPVERGTRLVAQEGTQQGAEADGGELAATATDLGAGQGAETRTDQGAAGLLGAGLGVAVKVALEKEFK